ncbi:MAG: hypothetical protein IJY94_06900 [Clostridia bacterium]|nr:hypothetical protein [Clostridia bacterium]
MKKDLRWMKLDNAAKIYPAARRRHWTNVFRLEVRYHDPVDPEVLKKALGRVIKRFPSVAARISSGIFWYYIEEIGQTPEILREEDHPLNRMTFRDIKKCAFRVLYYKNRMSVEIFHAITDGTGGMIFLKTLAAEYVRLRYGEDVPCENGILDINDEPQREELEDSFSRYTSTVNPGWKEPNAYAIKGTREEDGFMHVVTGIMDSDTIRAEAKKYGVTVTAFLAAVMMKSIYDHQNERVKNPKHLKPVRVLIPVNLRSFLPSKTMRNFAQYITPDIDPRLGEYTFEEMVKAVHHKMGLDLNAKYLSAKFTPNVRSEQVKILRVMPLFIKNFAMKLVYAAVGEKKASICMSNLGVLELPESMARHIERVDFVLGVQATSPVNCGVVSYNGKLIVNFVRGIKEPDLERHFFTTLRKMGIHVLVESNGSGN